jgi:fumarylacetoacetate (FAA) hydrolase
MKLASLKHGRDGSLVVVSQDLQWCARTAAIAPTMQAALDDWAAIEPRLRALSAQLESGEVGRMPFNPEDAAAPLPRAYQWADGSAYVNHVRLVRQARGAELPGSFWTVPLIYQGGSDHMLGARDAIILGDEAWGCDCEAEIAVILDDVPQGVSAAAASDHIKLVLLVNDVSLRNLIPPELNKGFGFYQSKPPTAFTPVAVTPDSLDDVWDGAKLHLPLTTTINGQLLGRPNAGQDMTFDFGQLIAHAAKTRPLGAGTVIGSGTVSNCGYDGSPGKPVADGGLGYSCIAELRMIEIIAHGAPRTPFLHYGDRVEIDMLGPDHRSIFGRIDQTVSPAA